MAIDDAYSGDAAIEFKIDSIQYEDDADNEPDPIEFEYTKPAVSMDTSGRFVKHEVIGGTTVRQKIGEDPIEVTVTGVCKKSVAQDLAALRDAQYGSIYHDHLPGNALLVQFASASTSPMSDSGAYPLDPDVDEFLYSFDLSCVEVTVNV